MKGICLEYYKELFFTKIKHSYDLHHINFHAETQDDIIKYDNKPSVGFKLVNNKFLDPKSGYIFHPSNSWAFKEKLITQNLLINGVCIKPIIFEYVKDGSFNIHLYEDVKDELMNVSVDDTVSLSESKPGTILRNLDDESYYIYMGMVGQYYVTENGKGSVKKKHLVLKTDYFNEKEDDTILIVSHFSYVDYTKDKEKNYFKVKDIQPENLKIKYYSYGQGIIPVGDYIENEKFQVYSFQKDYPSLMLSGTIRKVFDKDDIQMTRNNVKLVYEYLGTTGLDFVCHLKYASFDSKTKTFYNAELRTEIVSTKGIVLDFEKHNYVVEIDDSKYLIYPRRLEEINNYNPHLKADINLFQGYKYSTDVLFYKMNDASTAVNSVFYYPYSNVKNQEINWSQNVKIYMVEYSLNNTYRFNLFNNAFNPLNDETLMVHDRNIFNFLKDNSGVAINLFGDKK